MNVYKRISVEEAKKILKNGNSLLLDIRAHEDFEKNHDPQAFHLTSENLSSFVNSTDKDIPLLVMCYHGNSSQQVAKYLTIKEFTEVYSIDGGYEAWIKFAD